MTVCSGARWRRRARSLHSAAILTSALVTGRSSARRQGFALPAFVFLLHGLDNAFELPRRHPDVFFVIDHFGLAQAPLREVDDPGSRTWTSRLPTRSIRMYRSSSVEAQHTPSRIHTPTPGPRCGESSTRLARSA
jgi:hypothetical protein